MQKIKDLQLKGERVLIRVDYNVPLQNGLVVDDFRIRASLPTIKHCLNSGASVVLMSHLGRPKGEIVPENSILTLNAYVLNLLPYIKQEPMYIDDAFAQYQEDILIIKDDSGNFYVPEYGINSIDILEPNKGYSVFLSSNKAKSPRI